MEPPCKAPKLSLSEAANILNQQHPNLETVNQPSNSVSVSQDDEQITTKAQAADFSQEEVEENTQIQASLPLYFDHLFGTCIGHSQSQISPFCLFSQSQASILPQCSLGFSLTDTRILDSQGFIFNTSQSATSNSPISAPPPPPSPTQTQLLKFQPTSDTCTSTAVLKSSSIESPAAIIFSSPSSTSSSPGARSNRSGTPVLFPSPSSVHSHSPESSRITVTKFMDAQIQEPLSIQSNKPAEPLSRVSPHQQQDSKGSPTLCQSLRKQLTCTQCSHSHQSTCHKRKLDFEAVTSCLGNKSKYVCPPNCTPLSDCTQIHRKASIFAIVLQVNPVMEVACKAGSKAGYTVPMSSLLLGDPTKSYFKLSLWREAAAWVERISAGDVILFKNIKLRSWQREVVGTTIMYSSVLNLHQPKKQLPDRVKNLIPLVSLDSLMQWGRKHYGYLFDNPSLQQKSQKIVNFLTSCDLGKESLIHFRAKVLSLISSRVILIADEPETEIHLYLHFYPSVSEKGKRESVMAASICEAVIKSIVLIIEEEESVGLPRLKATTAVTIPDFITAAQIEAAVTKLWPECPDSFSPSETEGLCVDASLWHSQLSGGVGQVWEFMFIAVTLEGATQGGGYSLQTTSCSSLRLLQDDCQQATDILTKFTGSIPGSTFILRGCIIANITATRTSGIVEVEAKATAAWFLLCDGTRLDLSKVLQVANEEVISLLCQAVYVGCELCSKPLQQDTNGVYCQCLPCMLKKPGGYPSSAYYFRPMLICLQDSTGVVVILVTYAVIPKVLGIHAARIVKASLAQSEEFRGTSEAVRKSWQLLQSCDNQTLPTKWIINCTISKDENSFLEAVYFSLLDINCY